MMASCDSGRRPRGREGSRQVQCAIMDTQFCLIRLDVTAVLRLTVFTHCNDVYCLFSLLFLSCLLERLRPPLCPSITRSQLSIEASSLTCKLLSPFDTTPLSIL